MQDMQWVERSDLSIASHVCGLHPHWFGWRGVPAPSGEQPDPPGQAAPTHPTGACGVGVLGRGKAWSLTGENLE